MILTTGWKDICRGALVCGLMVSCLAGTGCVDKKTVSGSPAVNSEAAAPEATGTGSDSADLVAKTRGDEAAETQHGGDSSPPKKPAADAGQKDSTTEVAQQDAANPAPPPGEAAGNDPAHPFPQRLSIPDFPQDMEWLNVAGPLRKQDLKGKFVLLDFWTYCCINCIHILPELKKLEHEYPNQLVVIGVHSAKFETEKGTKNIEEAILRYEIEHPVVNDAEHRIWDTYGVRSWPTAILIDPEGFAVWGRSGEFQFPEVDQILKRAIPYYRDQQTLDETPVRFELAAARQKATPLRFPGKVLADEAGGRLFIADSNHNRIVVSSLDGKVQAIIGSGAIGRADGTFESASFDHPQGMVLQNEILYVADTENHLLRKIDLAAKKVTTIAGIGEQGRGWPGQEKLQAGDEPPLRWVGKPLETALNSPWDLYIHGKDLYIAMAGPHQIWKMPLDESEIGPYAGNGREDIVDGPLLSRYPYERGYSSFAQPSGLAADGEFLYVADSEGSSIRAVPFDPKKDVQTVVGTDELPFNRLFHFGDRDGPREKVLLQHCLGVVYANDQLYVADTYNNKIKVVDPKTGDTKTVAGTGEPGFDDAAGLFDEPAGISWAKGLLYVADTNNHQIRTVDPASGKVATVQFAGLTPPAPQAEKRKPDFSRANQVAISEAKVNPKDQQIELAVSLQLPDGWKINPAAPMRYWLDAPESQAVIAATALGEKKLENPAAKFSITLPVEKQGASSINVSLVYYYCQEGGEGLCRVGSVVWKVPFLTDPAAATATIELPHQVEEKGLGK